MLISPCLPLVLGVSLIHKGSEGWPGQGPGTAFWQEKKKGEGKGPVL